MNWLLLLTLTFPNGEVVQNTSEHSNYQECVDANHFLVEQYSRDVEEEWTLTLKCFQEKTKNGI